MVDVEDQSQSFAQMASHSLGRELSHGFKTIRTMVKLLNSLFPNSLNF